MKRITTLIGILALLGTGNVAAMPIAGHTDLDIAGDLYTFTFDTVIEDDPTGFPSDIISANGLFFTDGSIPWRLVAEATGPSSNTRLIQDHPRNGGLGVLPGPVGDNWAYQEQIKFTLSDNLVFDLVGFTVNGGNTGGAHGDCVPNGNAALYLISGGKGGIGSFFSDRDGCAANGEDTEDFSADPIFGDWFSDLSYIEFDSVQPGPGIGLWAGYLESITIRVESPIPAPPAIALLLVGLLGLRLSRKQLG